MYDSTLLHVLKSIIFSKLIFFATIFFKSILSCTYADMTSIYIYIVYMLTEPSEPSQCPQMLSVLTDELSFPKLTVATHFIYFTSPQKSFPSLSSEFKLTISALIGFIKITPIWFYNSFYHINKNM